ncbi:MAG: hypothetical protein U0996_10455 [Planctomycetaceae bacterium]
MSPILPVTLRALTIVFGLLLSTGLSASVSAANSERSVWNPAEATNSGRVQVLLRARTQLDVNAASFVITHGMGGTESDDRFHQLADAIAVAVPDANVIRLDWSESSRRTATFMKLPSPWAVAQQIDPVAEQAAQALEAVGLDAARTTFIGESFGNCVNAQIARQLGGHGKILAFNPPNDMGGFRTPDLRTCSDLAWSFQTFSLFDTQAVIADTGFFLQTPAEFTARQQHVAGISWLATQLEAGNTAWLLMKHDVETGNVSSFDAVADFTGELLKDQHPSRIRTNDDSGNEV